MHNMVGAHSCQENISHSSLHSSVMADVSNMSYIFRFHCYLWHKLHLQSQEKKTKNLCVIKHKSHFPKITKMGLVTNPSITKKLATKKN